MAVRVPAWIDGVATPAADARMGGQVFSMHGVCGDTDLAVTQTPTASMAVRVAAGRVVIPDGSGIGSFTGINDGLVTLTISPSHGSLARRDLVVARIYDHSLDGSGRREFALEVITGTPSASPATPATPTRAWPLAVVQVAAGATTITNGVILSSYGGRATVLGGLQVVNGTTPVTANIGDQLYDRSDKSFRIWDGSNWRPPHNLPWGRVASLALTTGTTALGGSMTDVGSASLAFTRVSGRRYKASWKVGAISSAGAAQAGVRLTDNANTELDADIAIMTAAGVVGWGRGEVELPSGSGSYTLKLRGIVISGTSVTSYANTVAPVRIIVEDIGPV